MSWVDDDDVLAADVVSAVIAVAANHSSLSVVLDALAEARSRALTCDYEAIDDLIDAIVAFK